VARASRAAVCSSIGGQTRADFFKSLHESAKSASGELFADFLQTFFHELQTFCRLFADFFRGSTAPMHTFCTLSAHFLQQMIQALQTSCTLIMYLQTFCRTCAHFLQRTCFHFADFMHTYSRPDADLMQIKLVHCRILADSMHILRRANQCH